MFRVVLDNPGVKKRTAQAVLFYCGKLTAHTVATHAMPLLMREGLNFYDTNHLDGLAVVAAVSQCTGAGADLPLR